MDDEDNRLSKGDLVELYDQSSRNRKHVLLLDDIPPADLEFKKPHLIRYLDGETVEEADAGSFYIQSKIVEAETALERARKEACIHDEETDD